MLLREESPARELRVDGVGVRFEGLTALANVSIADNVRFSVPWTPAR